MVDHGIETKADTLLRRYQGQLVVAQRNYEEARNAFVQAKTDLRTAEAVFEGVREMAIAANADREQALGLDAISATTRLWLYKLISYPAAGTAELADAALAVGWNATPATIRQKTKRLTEKGVLLRLGNGTYRVSDRAVSILGDRSTIASSGSVPDCEPPYSRASRTSNSVNTETRMTEELESDLPEIRLRESQVDSHATRQQQPDDEYDDDLPF